MSYKKIRAALESHLATLSPTLSTAYENNPFKPTPGTAYQRCFLLPANSGNPLVGHTFSRETGVFQVDVLYPLDKGPNDAQTRAELIRTHFARGTVVTASSLSVTIQGTPSVSSGFVSGDRFVLSVSINYLANVFI